MMCVYVFCLSKSGSRSFFQKLWLLSCTHTSSMAQSFSSDFRYFTVLDYNEEKRQMIQLLAEPSIQLLSIRLSSVWQRKDKGCQKHPIKICRVGEKELNYLSHESVDTQWQNYYPTKSTQSFSLLYAIVLVGLGTYLLYGWVSQQHCTEMGDWKYWNI